jgi:2-polyprenyl-3-methyl-5-hydroxy-6-metoxy-1,4-benzoquinol methylase
MIAQPTEPAPTTVSRARQSRGVSSDAVHRMVARNLGTRRLGGSLLLDVGCGSGKLWASLAGRFDRYIGADVVCYDGFPADGTFCPVNLDAQRVMLPDATADVVVAVETIEHLENPRAFVRELVRLTRPGGWVVVTTPNQLSLLSKLTLVLKNQFNAFQEESYPAHLTALLEIDLRRMAAESGLTDIAVAYSKRGRIVGTPWHYPRILSCCFPRALSDNILVIGRKHRD